MVAGATGVVGRPLVAQLLAGGHSVAALTRSERAGEGLRARGVETYPVDVFDESAVTAACVAAAPEVVIGELTALPQAIDMRRYAEQIEPTNRLRTQATPNLIAGARAAGVRRLIVQSISFITAPEGPLIHDEDARPYEDAPAALRGAVRAALNMERGVLAAADLSPIVLRYGFLYGPGTYYGSDGAITGEVRRRRFPLVGRAGGVSSFVHADDAAAATVQALENGPPGLYNVTDDEPAALRDWLPALASAVGAKPPLRVPALVARLAAGSHAVHFATTLRGNANARFKAAFGWRPAHPSWRTGFVETLRG